MPSDDEQILADALRAKEQFAVARQQVEDAQRQLADLKAAVQGARAVLDAIKQRHNL